MSRIVFPHRVTPCDASDRPGGSKTADSRAVAGFVGRSAARFAAVAVFVLAAFAGGSVLAQDAQPSAEATSTAPARAPRPPEFANVAEAQAAADAAKTERAAAVEAYQARVRECMHKFFVTNCTDNARQTRNDETERADGAKQRAELFMRQEKSREHKANLAAENAKRDARDAEKAAEARQTEAAKSLAAPAPARPGSAATPGNSPRAAERAPRPARTEDDPAVRASNRATYERKQEEARIYAEKQARERAENEDKRARRRAQREADAAKLNNPGTPAPANPTMAK